MQDQENGNMTWGIGMVVIAFYIASTAVYISYSPRFQKIVDPSLGTQSQTEAGEPAHETQAAAGSPNFVGILP